MPSDRPSVDINCGKLFPFQFLLLGVLLLIGGGLCLILHPIISIIAILAGIIILTAREGTEIDPASNTYREYNYFLLIKTGKWKKYPRIEKIFVNPVRVGQKIYTPHTLDSSTFSNTEFKAYLKFSDGVKVFLQSHKNKTRLLHKLSVVGNVLQVPVEDNTVII